MFFLLIILVIIISELLYFRVAEYYNIIDKPNERSLHSKITIRGGGIVFPISAFIYFFYSDMQYPYFFIGLFIISLISFLDDIYTIPTLYRVIIHFLSVSLLFFNDFNIYVHIGFALFFLQFIIVGIINAYNFMDGVNGMTGGYSFINLLSLLFVNMFIVKFIENEFIIFIALGIVVFNCFNFRKEAKSFAGDIGSISIAFIIIFLLLKLIFASNQYIYILFLTLYGIDTIFTIIIRIWQKENIFEAHRKHFFQLLVYKSHFSHLHVSSLYSLVQLIINVIVIFLVYTKQNSLYLSFLIVGLLSIAYVYFRVIIIKTSSTVK